MDIRQLRFFLAVAEHLNFTEAAKHLYVAQPAVSQQIADLENQIGVKLFIRDKRSVQLTAAGKVLFEESRALIEKTEEILEKTRKAAAGLVGTLKIGFLASAVKNHLPHTVKLFRAKYPDVSLELKQYTMGPLHEALEHGTLDIGFTMSFDLQNETDLVWRTLYSDVVSIVLRDDHPLAAEPQVSFSDLAKEPFVLLSPEQSPRYYDFINRLCLKRGFLPNIVNFANLMETVLILVENGIGVSIVPRHTTVYNVPNLRFQDVDGEDAQIEVVVAWKKVASNPAVPLFLRELGIADCQDEENG
ncbi:MAG: hdfR 3 [Firmicutes bacterium]|nr:hdfR 3 [Bacillota bacterium]